MNNDPKLTDAEIDAGIEAILAKDDTEIMLDQLRELFGDDVDVDSRFTVAQVLTAMEASHHHAIEHMQIVQRAFDTAASRSMNNDLIERAEAMQRIKAWFDHAKQHGYGDDLLVNETFGVTLGDLKSAMQGEVVEPTEAKIGLAERAIEEWLATHDGEEIDCRALARIAVMQGEVGGLREALVELSTAVCKALGVVNPERDIGKALTKAEAALAASPPVDQGRMTQSKRHKFQMSLATTCEHCIHCGAIAGVEITADGKLSGTMNEDCPALTNKGANP